MGSPLETYRAQIEARWLELADDQSAYVGAADDRQDALRQALFDALSGAVQPLVEWADRQVEGRVTTYAAILSLIEAFSQAVQDVVPVDQREAMEPGLSEAILTLAHRVADLAQRLRVERSQLQTLYGITRQLSSSLDLSQVLHKSLSELVTATGAGKGMVALVNEPVTEVETEVSIDWPSQVVAVDLLPPTWQMGRDEPMLELSHVEPESVEEWVNQIADPGTGSLLAGPLIANGQFRGILALGNDRPDAFSANQAELFQNVLSQVATAIGNAEVYRLISQQAQELGQMFRRQQEQATEREAILTSIADGVVVNSAAGEVILVNPAAERIIGKEHDELLGEDFQELFAGFDEQGRDEAIGAMENLLQTSAPELAKSSRMNLETDGRVVRALLSPVLDEQDNFKGVVTVFRDITKEVEADRAKSEFVSTVSHELRTPMTAIKGYTDLLHAEAAGPLTDEQTRFLTTIKSNTDRLTALISDLLDISRMETGRVRFEPRPLQIGEVVADVVNALAAHAESKGLDLSYEVAAGLPDVMGDHNRLNQVLTNLISNAIRYTPEGGEIDVSVYEVERAVRVDVSDTGIGIAPEDMAHLFERFYRADHPLVQETRGTGLGLSIVKMFVEMHGGRVWVESDPGQGSTFTFILPIPVQEEAEGARRLPKRLTADIRKVLVVDDDRDAADLARHHLQASGYKVFVMGRGEKVKAWAEENQPDLILLDLILPDVGGLEVLESLKEDPTTSDIPVIVQSIVPDDGSAWELGIADYVTKPIDGDQLVKRVEEAMTWEGRVLIVEDDPDTVELLAATMRQVGFTPLVAADGYEALTMTRRYRPDLILLDLRLPGMDGYEALTHLKRDAVTQTIPIIAISAHVADNEQERNRLIALGASSFLPKPFSIGDLLGEVEAALQPVASPSPASVQ